MHTPIRGHASMTHIIISHPSFCCIYSARLLKKASTLAPLLPAIHSGQDASSMEGIPSEVDLDSSMTGFSPPMAQEPRAIKDPYPKMARNIFYNIENNQNEQNVTHSSQAVVIPIHTAQHSTAQHRKHHTHTYSTLRNTLNTTPMQFIEFLPSFTHSLTHSPDPRHCSGSQGRARRPPRGACVGTSWRRLSRPVSWTQWSRLFLIQWWPTW
jgi:hypothetical protein